MRIKFCSLSILSNFSVLRLRMLFLYIIQAFVCAFLAYIFSQFGFVHGFVSFACYIFGYWLSGQLLFKSNRFWDLSAFIKGFLADKAGSRGDKPVTKVTIGDKVTVSNAANPVTKEKRKPWDGLLVPEIVDEALVELLELTIKTHIHSWYLKELSSDHSFLLEIRYHIRYVLCGIWKKVGCFDLTTIILNKLIPAIISHAHTYITLRQKCGEECPDEQFEHSLLEKLRPNNFHWALYSRDTELTYLRSVVQFLINKFADHDRVCGWGVKTEASGCQDWPESVNVFVRELIVLSLLLPLGDLTAQPYIIDKLLLLLLDEEAMMVYTDPPTHKVNLLHSFCLCLPSQSPDSLLQEKLTDIMKDQGLMYRFTTFLKSTRGPLNLFQFVLAAGPIHDQFRDWINTYKNCNDPLSEEKCSQKMSEGVELNLKTWGLYQEFIHHSSIDSIDYDDLNPIFEDALKMTDLDTKLECLDGVLDTAYTRAYRSLQFDHVVPFCQSDVYWDYTCGSRSSPPTLNSLDTCDKPPLAIANEGAFNFTTLKQRLTGVWTASIEEGQDMFLELASEPDESYVAEIVSESMLGLNGSVGLDEIDSLPISPDQLPRNMNEWMVSIPRINPSRDLDKGTIYVFVIDVTPPGMKSWNVQRQFNEFYVLESKLVQFHGPRITGNYPLPTKKVLVAKSRVFMESHRNCFEQFLLHLTSNPNLKASQLLHSFLATTPQFTAGWVPDALNPWRAIKNVPSKLLRERGQNLTGYFASLCQSVDPNYVNNKRSKKCSDGRSEGGISQHSVYSNTCIDRKELNDLIYRTVYNNNCAIQPTNQNIRQNGPKFDRIAASLYDLCLYVLWCCVRVKRTFMVVLVPCRIFLRDTIDSLVAWLLRRKLDSALHERRIMELINLIRDVLFFEEPTELTEVEKKKYSNRLHSALLSYLNKTPSPLVKSLGGSDKLESLVQIFVEAIEHPRLNKHLFYVLLDHLLITIFNDI